MATGVWVPLICSCYNIRGYETIRPLSCMESGVLPFLGLVILQTWVRCFLWYSGEGSNPRPTATKPLLYPTELPEQIKTALQTKL